MKSIDKIDHPDKTCDIVGCDNQAATKYLVNNDGTYDEEVKICSACLISGIRIAAGHGDEPANDILHPVPVEVPATDAVVAPPVDSSLILVVAAPAPPPVVVSTISPVVEAPVAVPVVEAVPPVGVPVVVTAEAPVITEEIPNG